MVKALLRDGVLDSVFWVESLVRLVSEKSSSEGEGWFQNQQVVRRKVLVSIAKMAISISKGLER